MTNITQEFTSSKTHSEVELDEDTKSELGAIELKTMQYTLADAIREGSQGLKQVYAWGDGVTNGCALTAAVVAANKRNYL